MIDIKTIRNSKSCEEVFVNDKVKTKEIYRELAKKYHPDICKSKTAGEDFAKITLLYNEAVEKIEKGIWFEKDVLFLESVSNKKYKLKYLKKQEFELGNFYIGRNHLIYVLEAKNKKYLDNALKVLRSLKYENSEMEKEFKRYFPQIVDTFELKTGEHCLVLKKDSTDFLLEDLDKYYKNQGSELYDKHCAWVISRLSNIACFLKYNGLVHNGISLTNCFISPKYHTIMLLGGWWYCVPNGEKMLGTQKSVYDVMPIKEKSEKKATYQTDLECVKQIGRQLNKKTLPKPFQEWLDKGALKDAYNSFDEWNSVLYQSYGERKFIELNISEKDIYNM
jgi:serine/threonine protein kinase